jgi:histidinol phosphatase-like enzyme (inositol monophosphatase family)
MTAIDFSGFVDELATHSGQAIMPFFRSSLAADDKSAGGVFDPVTEADRASEAIMRRMIQETFPEHGIVGEEYGSHNPDARHVWVLDPIDGTKAFISGLPTWGTLIGLKQDGIPIYGMMHQPFTGERFSGNGKTARLITAHGEQNLRTRPCSGLENATLMTTSPRLLSENERSAYERVENIVRLPRYGCDCYAYCVLAAGHIDLVIEAGLKPYDIVALIPIVEGAGGIVTSWTGGPATDGGAVIASGDRRVHDAALHLLNA